MGTKTLSPKKQLARAKQLKVYKPQSPEEMHVSRVIGTDTAYFVQCSCGEVYPAGQPHPAVIDYAWVTLFKPSGKYYTEEPWLIPPDALGPFDMDKSPDWRTIGNGAVLVQSQEPWGFPHLFPGID